MRNVIFVAPFSLENTMRFVRAVRGLNHLRLIGICQTPPNAEDRRLYDDLIQVPDALDARQLIAASKGIAQKYGPIHRVLGILEPLQVQLGEVREALGVPGTTAHTADLFREKARMKDELRRHGLPCARHALVTTWAEAERFIDEVGAPLVMKPPAGAGCKATWRISSKDELRSALGATQVGPGRPALIEEFLRGREYSFETITIGGEVRWMSATRYFPTPLEVMETPWMQWAVVLMRDLNDPELAGIHELGVRTVKALGLETGMTHMEWFRKDDGSLAIGEIAARPPGAQIVLANSFAYDHDMYRAWARAVVDDAFDGPDAFRGRKYAVGTAFLRGIGRGRVTSVTGVEEANRKVGHLVVRSQLPVPGVPRADTYEGDGYVVVRHPDTEVVKSAIKTVIETIKVNYG
jgi:biotin carboxylase